MNIKKDAKKHIKKAAKATSWEPMRFIGNWGVKSRHAYTAGLVASGFSMLSWYGSRAKKNTESRGSWSLYLGQCAVTFFVIGLGLKQEEKIL